MGGILTCEQKAEVDWIAAAATENHHHPDAASWAS
jgi:hypothetical protein